MRCTSMSATPRALGAFLMAATWLVAGCTHVLVQDERRGEQAQETKKLVGEARLGDTLAALETSFAAVAAMEESRARDRATYLFDAELRIASRAPKLTSTLKDGGSNGLQTVVEERLAKIGLVDASPEGLRRLRESGVRFTVRQRALEAALIEFRGAVGHRFENCKAIHAASEGPEAKSDRLSPTFLNSLPKDRREVAQLKYPALVEDCLKLDQVLAERDKLFAGGGIKTVQSKLDGVRRELIRYELDMKSAREELEKATAALRDSGAKASSTLAATGKLTTVESRAMDLTDLVHLLSLGGDTVGEGAAHAMAAEKLSRLEAVLGAIAGTPSDASVKLNQDEKVSIAVIRGIPALADDADKLLTQARRPRLVPFVAAVDQQKLVLQGFEAGRNAKRTQESAVRRELEANVNEATALASVLTPLKSNADWAQRSVSQLLEELRSEKKIDFLRALAIYADEVKLHRVDGAAWKVRAEAVQYEESLARSKFATARWDALTETIATVLADFHGDGIEKPDLAEFFKAVGLVTIGLRIPK